MEDKKKLNFISKIILQETNWDCRVPMTPEKKFFVPLSIPLWGFIEPTHVHLVTHLNFVFHASFGHIVGATAYPSITYSFFFILLDIVLFKFIQLVRDNFQFTEVGTVIQFHGPVKFDFNIFHFLLLN